MHQGRDHRPLHAGLFLQRRHPRPDRRQDPGAHRAVAGKHLKVLIMEDSLGIATSWTVADCAPVGAPQTNWQPMDVDAFARVQEVMSDVLILRNTCSE